MISLIENISIESYYNVIKSNPDILMNPGLLVDGKYISLYAEIKDENKNEVVKTMYEIFNKVNKDKSITIETSVEKLGAELKIKSDVSNFRVRRVYKKFDMEDQNNSVNSTNLNDHFILNLYGIDVSLSILDNDTTTKVPIHFTLVNDNDVPSILLVEQSIKLFSAYNPNPTVKTIPLSNMILTDIIHYLKELLTPQDLIILNTYNSLDNYKKVLIPKKEYGKYQENMMRLHRVFENLNLSHDVLEVVSEKNSGEVASLYSIPVLKFKETSSNMDIDTLLVADNNRMLHNIRYEDYKNNTDRYYPVLLSNEEAFKLEIEDFDYNIGMNVPVSGKIYLIEDRPIVVENLDGTFSSELNIIAEAECYGYNRIGAVEFIGFGERGMEDTVLMKSINAVKAMNKLGKEITNMTKDVGKNKLDYINYVTGVNETLDKGLKGALVILQVGGMGLTMVNPALGVLATTSATLLDKTSKSPQEKRKEMKKTYEKHVQIMDEAISEAESRGDNKAVVRLNKAKKDYLIRIRKIELS